MWACSCDFRSCSDGFGFKFCNGSGCKPEGIQGSEVNALQSRCGSQVGRSVSCSGCNKALWLESCPHDVGSEFQALAARTGRRDVRVWHRQDLGTRTYGSTSKTGPIWEHVLARVTLETGTSRVIESKLTSAFCRSQEHGRLAAGK